MEVNNFNPMGLDGYGTAAEYLWVVGEGSGRFSLRARGVVLGDEPSDDINVQHGASMPRPAVTGPVRALDAVTARRL